MRLTIAIPTYDRPEALRATVETLLDQLDRPELAGSIRLRVRDNASPVPAEEVLAGLLARGSSLDVAVERNRVNLGANANLLRCVEVADTPWIWLLGDDDAPLPNAAATALAALSADPEALCVNFASPHGAGPQDFSTFGRAELLERFPAFGNLLFLSTNLYRVEPLLAQLYLGYRYAYSMGPHLAMLLMALGEAGQVRFRDERLVAPETKLDGAHWSAINQALSIPTLLELPLAPRERRTLARKLHLPDLPNQLIQLLGTGDRRGEFASSAFYYRQIAARVWPYTPLPRKALLLAARLAFVFPRASRAVVELALRKLKRQTIADRLRADTTDPRL